MERNIGLRHLSLEDAPCHIFVLGGDQRLRVGSGQAHFFCQ